MDSENDMHVANDSDVYQYSRGYNVMEEEDDSEPNYTILSEEDILERQNETITAVSELLYISKADARFLLRHFKWNVGKISDEWFANEEKVRMDVGLLEKPVVEVRPYEKEVNDINGLNAYFKYRLNFIYRSITL